MNDTVECPHFARYPILSPPPIFPLVRPVLYVAGPYTRPDPVENTHYAAKVATIIYEQSQWVPLVPHLTLAWHLVCPRPAEFWYDLDLHHIAACAGIVRLPGASSGADRELEFAHYWGISEIAFTSLPQEAQDVWLASR